VTPRRSARPVLIALVLAAAATLAPAPAGAPAAKPPFKAFASCANGRPFEEAKHCRYDARTYFRGTFVFKSKIGKRPVKACFQIYGPKPLGGGHACAKLKPLAFKAYPFKITGVRQRFSVKVTWFVKEPGENFEQVAASSLKVKP
jgi:hypothetical protein